MSDTPATAAFPLAPPPFAGNSRVVPASSAFDWLQFGWLMFLAEAGIWVGAAVLLLVCLLLVNFVPFIGMAAAHFLLPVFTGGLMLGCREIENGGKLHLPLVATLNGKPFGRPNAGKSKGAVMTTIGKAS